MLLESVFGVQKYTDSVAKRTCSSSCVQKFVVPLIDDVNPSKSLLCEAEQRSLRFEARMTVRAARRSGKVLQVVPLRKKTGTLFGAPYTLQLFCRPLRLKQMWYLNILFASTERIINNWTGKYLIDDVNPSRSLLCEARMTIRTARRSGEVLQRNTPITIRRFF